MRTWLIVAALAFSVGCDVRQDLGQPVDAGADGHTTEFTPSNGVQLMAGIDPSSTTTLSGSCRLVGERGSIDCDGLVIRLNAPGVYNDIGWEVIGPAASSCAGGGSAPSIAVFSFGSLVVADGTSLEVDGRHAVAFVAARRISVQGVVRVNSSAGGFPGADVNEGYPGPGAGVDATGQTPGGAGGAGGAMNPPENGGDGVYGGGGGGSAGFIRVRTTSCPASFAQFVPAPACEAFE